MFILHVLTNGCEFSFNRSVLTNRPAVFKNYSSRIFVVITSLFPLIFVAGCCGGRSRFRI